MDDLDFASEHEQRRTDALVARRVRYAGVSRCLCIDCDEPIPEARRNAIPGVERCCPCQDLYERFG